MAWEEVGVGLPVRKVYGDMSHSLGAINNQKSLIALSKLIEAFNGKNSSIDM
jgi:hypothetical protein